jgi:hypothetical protein
MTARALARPLGLLAIFAALGCLPPPEQKEDPVAETMRMLKDSERTVQASGGASQNILVRVERVRTSAEDGAGLAALWRYSDDKLTISGRDGLAAGGVRLGGAGPKFQAELSAWSARAKGVEKTREEIVVQSGRDGLLAVTSSALVPVLRVVTPSGQTTVLQSAQVGAQLAVRPQLVEGGRIELSIHPSFSAVSGARGAETYSLEAFSTRVTLAPGQKLLLGASSSAARDSAAMGLFGFNQRGEQTACVVLVSVERL